MKLKELLIYDQNGYVIRKIVFNLNGPSLIVDKTNKTNEGVVRKSGSSVGKTTVTLIIDICLGKEEVESIYDSKDASGSNQTVEAYLNNNKVIADLTVIDGENEYVLRRGLYKNGLMAIDESEYTKLNEYYVHLNKLFFGIEASKPSVRQLMPFFVRIEAIKEKIYLKYLPSVQEHAQYQALYSSLFHLDWFDVSNLNLIKDNKKDEKYEKIMLSRNNVKSVPVLEKKIEIISNEVKQLKDTYSNFKHLENYKQNEEEFLALENQIKESELQYQSINIQIKNIEERINETKTDLQEYEKKALELLINDTKRLLNVSFENELEKAINFYRITQNKQKEILKEQLEQKKMDCKQISDFLNKERLKYEEQYKGFSSDLAEEYEKKYTEFIKKNEDLMRAKLDYEEIQKLQNNYVEPSPNYENALDITKKIDKFNTYFKRFTKQTIKKEAAVVYNVSGIKPTRGKGFIFPFDITGSEGNMGTSKSKLITADFVFAYIKYAEEQGFQSPHFYIADKLESIELQELKPLMEISKENDIQFIFPILSDRISQSDFITDDEIVLELSQDEKLFKI